MLRHWREDSKWWQSTESFPLRRIIYTLASRVYRILLMQMKHVVNSVSVVTQLSLHMLYWGVVLGIPMGVWGDGGRWGGGSGGSLPCRQKGQSFRDYLLSVQKPVIAQLGKNLQHCIQSQSLLPRSQNLLSGNFRLSFRALRYSFIIKPKICSYKISIMYHIFSYIFGRLSVLF